MNLSIIIPTYNEEKNIADILSSLCKAKEKRSDVEIIVSDASDDDTLHIASDFCVTTCGSPKGRAVQMNHGAERATGEVLYFLHADTRPPSGFIDTILSAKQSGKEAGCFQLTFDDPHWLMQTYGWFTRLPLTLCRGGDQSLFIMSDLFKRIGGFNEELRVMEDIEIIERISTHSAFTILDDMVTTSSRKYTVHGRVRLQVIFGLIHLLYALGFDRDIIADYYAHTID